MIYDVYEEEFPTGNGELKGKKKAFVQWLLSFSLKPNVVCGFT